MRDILAIVGSEHWPDSSYEEMVKDVVRLHLARRRPDKVISGGAPGVDRWAVEIACEMAIEFEEFLPKRRQWAPEGFRDRNIIIGQTCTRLLAIRYKHSRRYGAGWTADYTHGLGKPVKRINL